MTPRANKAATIRCFDDGNAHAASEIAGALGVSRQMAHRTLRALVYEGRLVRDGAGRSVRYRAAGTLPFSRHYTTVALAEDRVWADVSSACDAIRRLPPKGRGILEYVFSEILNNAIEHAEAAAIHLCIDAAERGLAFEIADDGIGIFAKLQRNLGFKEEIEALQALSKGKVTTDPEHHTGEGIFFSSKAVSWLEIRSGRLRWIVDNVRGDMAVGRTDFQRGTSVRAVVARRPKRTIAELFAEYTSDFVFSKTRVVIRLFDFGASFVSRSEARRVVHGLERFRHVVFDFKGVEVIGQGFADEVFRVWPAAHPGVRVEAIEMAPPIEFLVKRARSGR